MLATNCVGVLGGDDAGDWTEVLSALANSCRLKLLCTHEKDRRDLAGLILLGPIGRHHNAQALKERPSIRVITADASAPAAVVRFGIGLSSPSPFRGREVLTASGVPSSALGGSGEVIATADGKPVWTTTSEGGVRHDTCWVTHPWIKKGECVFQHLNSDRFMNLLPLLEWFRCISDWQTWDHPPLRACFVIDDPNLHAARYGFLRFDQLAAEGRLNKYHTSLATVPLDGYYVNHTAARIIRDNEENLSLLVHGNNHTFRELARRRPVSAELALMRQAVARIHRLEQKAGVPVSRVMAPPHGVCSSGMMAAMVNAGLEAACISHGSVLTGNPGVPWTVSLGALPAAVISGLPVLARFGLDHKFEGNTLLASYLNQPIIPVAHHWDFSKGIDILSSAARFINGLGTVIWTSLIPITRSNFSFRKKGHVLQIYTFSRISTAKVPEGVTELQLIIPWLDSERESVECRISGEIPLHPFQVVRNELVRFCVSPGSIVDLEVVRKPIGCLQPYALPRTPLHAILRKLLVEMRDRSMPYLPGSGLPGFFTKTRQRIAPDRV